jgi:hypothetical protein
MYRVIRKTESEKTGKFEFANSTYYSAITTAYRVDWFGRKKVLFSYYKHLSKIVIDGKEHHKLTITILKNRDII